MTLIFPAPTQAAHGVRIVIVVLFLGLVAAGPIGMFWIDGHAEAATTAPELRLSALLDGSWQKAAEDWFRESSPLTRFARARFLDLEWLLGLDDNREVTSASPGWMFITESLRGVDDPARAAARQGFWNSIAHRAKRLDLRIIVLIAPDKAQVYPQFAIGRADLPPERARFLAIAIAEVRAAGLTALDVLDDLLACSRDYPADPLYARRDTHWNAVGAAIAARSAAGAVRETGIDLGPAVPVNLWTPELMSHPDLVERTLGYTAGTRAGELLRERHRSAFAIEAMGAHPAAKVALVGDSFAVTNFAALFAAQLGRAVDTAGAKPGTGPWRGLVLTLDRIERGALDSKIVVVVFIERSIPNDVWLEAEAATRGELR